MINIYKIIKYKEELMSESTSESSEINIPRNWKPKVVQSVKVTGAISRKLGCIDDPFLRQAFIMEKLESISNEEFVNYMKKYAGSMKEIEEFKAKVDSCDLVL